MFQGLQQVRLQRFAHDDRHRSGTLQLLGGYRITRLGVADNNATHARPHVLDRIGQRQDGHHFGCGGDVEAGLTSDAVGLSTQPDNDVAQAAIVDIQHPSPGDVVDVQAQFVALVKVVVDHCRQQIVRCSDRVEVASQVQVEKFHRNDLAVSAASGSAFDSKRRPHRRLAKTDDCLLADVLHCLAETDRGGGFTLAQGGRSDRGDHHILCLWTIAQFVDRLEADLGQIVAMLLEQMWPNAHLSGDVVERGQCPGASNFKVGRKAHGVSPLR